MRETEERTFQWSNYAGKQILLRPAAGTEFYFISLSGLLEAIYLFLKIEVIMLVVFFVFLL